jgi:hypothetical protein
MAIEELGQKYFSRERTRNRMLKRAAEIWGFSESEMDDFDPLVALLIEACAVEFEKIAGEIGKTQNRMLERLAQLLYPGMNAVKPAYGIMQVRSSEPDAILYPDAQFIYRPAGNDRKRDTQNMDLFFSPSHAIKIVDGTVKFIATGRELVQIDEGVQKLTIASSSKKVFDYQHDVWIGLELNEELTSLENISFFFNWLNQPGSESWYQYLPYTHWFADGIPLQHRPGLSLHNELSGPANRLEKEFDAMQKVEEELFELYNRHYITLASKETTDQLKTARRLYPKVFEQLFDKKELQELKEPLWWIQIQFPPVFPEEALDSLFCSINAIPVLNRKLNKFAYRLMQSLNIVSLETDGNFLAMREIANSQGQPVKLVPFANPSGMQPETYTLRYGVNRFDERNSYETLVNLTELIKEESSYFSSLGEDFLIQNIRELNQILARLEDKVKAQNKNQSPHPYLIIKPLREGANILIEFWSCNGELANKIAMGSRMTAYRNSHVKTNSVFFVTSTYGGRDKFNDAEKIDQYKKSLLTHDRIVTLPDLKAFTKAELGKSARSIEYKKTYVKGTRPTEGFVSCMQILVNPEPDSLGIEEWEHRLRELQLKLEKQSANHIPYQVKLAEDPT